MAEALDNTRPPVVYPLCFFLCKIIAVLWPSGYGVTFRLCPIRDGKPREFESRQCQLFLFLFFHNHTMPHIPATTLKMCYRALLSTGRAL